MPKQNKNFLSLHSKNPNEVYFVLANYSCPWCFLWSVVNIPSDTPLKKNHLSLCQQRSIVKNFLVKGGTLYLPPLFSAGILSGLNLYSSCRKACLFFLHKLIGLGWLCNIASIYNSQRNDQPTFC